MKVSVLQENLLRALDCAVLAVNKNTTFPILENVLIRTDGGRLQVASTDLETGIIAQIGARVEEDGEITIPAFNLRDYVQLLPDGKLDLSTEDKTQTLIVSAESKSATFKGIDAEEFPIMPEIPNGGAMTDEDLMRKAIAAVLAVRANKTRHDVDWSENIKVGINDGVTLTAQNISIIASRKVETWGNTAPFGGYVYRPALSALSRIITIQNKGRSKKNREPVEIANGDKVISFKVAGVTVLAEWADTEFPKVNDVVPVSTFTVDAEDLASALKVAAAFSERVNVKVNGSLALEAISKDGKDTLAEMTTEVPCGHAGKDFEFSVYVKNALAALKGKRGLIVVGYTAEKTPLTITAGNDAAMMAIA